MLIDIILLLIIFCGVYFGHQFGVSKWLLYLVSILASVWVTLKGSALLLNSLDQSMTVRSEWLVFPAIIIVLGSWLFISWFLWNFLEPYFVKKDTGWISPLFTGLLGAICFTLSFACLLVFVDNTKLIPTNTLDHSFLAKPLLVTAEKTIHAVKGSAEWNEKLKGLSGEVFEGEKSEE
jgi:uncharacterized membrane protein required for colicin V production